MDDRLSHTETNTAGADAASSSMAGNRRASWFRIPQPLFARLRRQRRQWKVVGPAVPVAPLLTARAKPRRKAGWRVFTGLLKTFLVAAALGSVALGALVAWAIYDVPLDRSAAMSTAPSMILEASDGQPLGRRGPFRSPDVALADFPQTLIDAVLSIEDRRFFSHPGVDVLGIARAFSENMSAGHVVEGGSTITQQLVKVMLGDDERTLRRKLREAMVAIGLELRLGKPEILQRYLNSIYLGGGAYGMPAAADFYFSKKVQQLTLAECAMLAGMIHAPSQLNPLNNLADAQARAATVLDAMVDNGVITAEQAASAKASPAVPSASALQITDGTWFADWVSEEAGKIAGSNTGPIKLRTTLVPPLQKIAEQVVRDALAKSGKSAKVSQAALVALRPDGAVLAMVGGRDYQTNQFNRAARAQRQPGSSFKLFVYLAALRAGYTPDSIVEDAPISIRDPSTGKTWSPDNYGGQYAGNVTVADAFARSLNTAAVRLAMAAGPDKVVQAARDLGVDAPLSPYPSIALGTNEVTLLDITAAYASVMSGTMPVQPWGIAGVGTAGKNGLMLSAGSPVEKGKPTDHRAELLTLLEGVVQRGTARGAAIPGGYAAGKTGTTQNYQDAWFIGFDRSLVVGVWVGNDDNSPMEKVTGGSLPASIWKAFMTAAAPYETGIVVPPPVAAAPPAAAAAPFAFAQTAPSDVGTAGSCDIAACSAAYQSFRASDCTFQPYTGPRQVCTKGNLAPVRPQDSMAAVAALPAGPDVPAPAAAYTPVPAAERQAPPPPAQLVRPDAAPASNAAPSCDIRACSETYASFRASDCTYQPFGGGPRQVCTRGSGAGGPATVAGGAPPVDQTPPPQTGRLSQPQGDPRRQVPQSILDWLAGQQRPPQGFYAPY